MGTESAKEEEEAAAIEGQGVGARQEPHSPPATTSSNVALAAEPCTPASLELHQLPAIGMIRRNMSGSGGEKSSNEIREIFLRMEPGTRVSRSVRAEWLLEHYGGMAIEQQQPSQKGLSLFGMLPLSDMKESGNSRSRMGPNTSVTFLADAYRLIFILDLSPSSFVIDDLGCVLYNRLVQNLTTCLRRLVAKMSIADAHRSEFLPKICVSVCVFSPFICFPDENVLVQGALLTAATVDPLVHELLDRLKHYIDRLVQFSQPHMREWNADRRRNRRAGDRPEIDAPKLSGSDRGYLRSDWALIFMLRMGLIGVQMMGQTGRSLASIVLITDGVCGVSDQLALQGVLSQLRLNAVACSFVQLCPASLRGPCLGHVGFPELFEFIATATFGAALFENQLDTTADAGGLNEVQRALLTWSFGKGLLRGGGTVGLAPMMSFMGGKPAQQQLQMRTSHIRNKHFSRTYETSLARLLAIRLREGFSIRQLDDLSSKQMHQDPLQPAASSSAILIRLSLAWRPQVCIDYSIYVPGWQRICIDQRKKAKLRVDVFVEAAQLHMSTANLLGDKHDPGSLRSALVGLREADALLLHLNSFNSESHYWDLPKEVDRSLGLFELRRIATINGQQQRLALAERYEALRTSKFISYWQPLSSIDEGLWQKWMHTHAIRLILAHDLPLPERIFTAHAKGRFLQCSAELAFNELHAHLKRWASFTLVRDQSYVCLLHEEHSNNANNSANKSSGLRVPDQFCLIRVSMDIPCALIRLCFPPGVSGQTRDEVLAQFGDSLGRLRIVRELQFVLLTGERREAPNLSGSNQTVSSATPLGSQLHGGLLHDSNRQLLTKTMEVPSVCLFQKPFDRLLVRYKAVPLELHRIVRLERTESRTEKREQILHNATTKYLCCRRQVWHMRGVFMKNAVPALAALEFILQTLLRLRLRQGFMLAWSKNGIVNLIRQVPTEKISCSDDQQPVLEQCVLFGPTICDNQQHPIENGAPPRPRKSSLCADEELTTYQQPQLQQNGIDNFGTLESGKSAPTANASTFWPQIVAEVWTEPAKQSSSRAEENGIELSRKALLAENVLLIRTLFTFDQLMAVCNSRLWAEKPFVLDSAADCGAIPPSSSMAEEKSAKDATAAPVQFINGAFDLGALLQNATQRELMLLPAMGYAESDPHSLTRLSFLLKALQQELAEFCDVCIEVADEPLFVSLLHEMDQCLGGKNQWHNPTEEELLYGREGREDDAGEAEEEAAVEAELAELWRQNLPPLNEPPTERLTVPPRRPPPISTPPSPLPTLARHYSLGQHLQSGSQRGEPSFSIPNSPGAKSGLRTSFLLPTEDNTPKNMKPNFSESADARAPRSKKQASLAAGAGQPPQQLPNFSGNFISVADQQAMLLSTGQRSTSVPLLWTVPGLSPLKGLARAGGTRQHQKLGKPVPLVVAGQRGGAGILKGPPLSQKRASISGQKSATKGTMLDVVEEPRKKTSAPSSSFLPPTSGQQQKRTLVSNNIHRDQQRHLQHTQQQQRVLRFYAKRLNDWRLVIFVMAKDVRVCRGMMATQARPNTFPVLAYYCDKARMARHFVEHTADGRLAAMESWIVEDFSRKAELSTLAQLRQQVQRRESLSEGRLLGPVELDTFYLTGSFAAASAGTEVAELAAHYSAPFDLLDHCESVFEEFLFTKAFIGTVYTCLGQQLFVPDQVVAEALDYRCEHTNIEIGSINDILKDTCAHLGHQPLASRPRKRRRSLSSSASSLGTVHSSPSATSADENGSQTKRARASSTLHPTMSTQSLGPSSGDDTLVPGSKEQQLLINSSHNYKSGKATAVAECGDQLEDFRAAFEQLLRRHNFHRIPGLADYFFYWPQQPQEHSLSSFNLPGMEDYIQMSMPAEFASPPPSAHFSQQQPMAVGGEQHKASTFSRHSSARNTTTTTNTTNRTMMAATAVAAKEQPRGGRTRKPSASAASIGGGGKRRGTNQLEEELASATDLCSIRSRCCSDSTSWEQREEEESDSEKSSLAGELLCPELWPLFIQFYVAIQTAAGCMESSPVEFIPNCMKQIFDKCPLRLRLRGAQENMGNAAGDGTANSNSNNFFQLGQLQVNIDMYVLTWPLPSHCPYGEQSDEESSGGAVGATTAIERPMPSLEADGEFTRGGDLEELFMASDGVQWAKSAAGKGHVQQQQRRRRRQQRRNNSGDEVFERKVEMLRQIPTEERRLLRRLQRNVQKMLKTEHVLITSRGFDARRDVGALLRVVQFIREEASGAGAAPSGGGQAEMSTQTVARFAMCRKELVLVAEPQDGLRRLAEKLDGLWVDYCRLRQLPVRRERAASPAAAANAALPFELEALMDGTKLVFYSCGVEDLGQFARTRHESIRQLGSAFRRVHASEETTTATTVDFMRNSLKSLRRSGKSVDVVQQQQQQQQHGFHYGTTGEGRGEEPAAEDDDTDEEEEDDDELVDEEEYAEEEEGQGGDPFGNSSTTMDEGTTIAELTMPLNDAGGGDGMENMLKRQQRMMKEHHSADEDFSLIGGFIERKQLLHDFWLIVHLEQQREEEEAMNLSVYFCQRNFLLHDQLFESACQQLDEQVRLVNQELLLEKMHRTEECDPLLLEHDSFASKSHFFQQQQQQRCGDQPNHHFHHHKGGMTPLDSVQGSAVTRSAQNVPGEALSRHIAGSRMAQNRPSSLLLETEPGAGVAVGVGGGGRHAAPVAPRSPAALAHAHHNNSSLTFSDEDEHSEISESARFKFRPGHFACDLVWHHWFAIHPRLQPSRAFGASGNDIGFKALRLGLEGLAVRNRSNMYVYKERNGNVVYMRLHCTDESVLANIPSHGPGWEEEVRQHSSQCILLAVHGVRSPGEEITVQLRSVLQRRLNSRTLEEIQNALLKNAHIRLEPSDIRFIQREPSRPSSVFFFTVPQAAQRHLASVKYYLNQQMLTFCISPKFREQSGAPGPHAHHGRNKFSGEATGSRYFSGGSASIALSLTGTPTIEQQQQTAQQREIAETGTAAGNTGGGRETTVFPLTHPYLPPAPHSFVPYSMPNAAPNPPNYTPTYYLVNKPPGEGKRDNGIACLEVKLVDWECRWLEHTEEGRLDADSHALLYPGLHIPSPVGTNTMQRAVRLHELSRCLQVEKPMDSVPVPGTCALFQFNMWQNGNVGVEDLQGRLKMCVQQAICDLVTEFGLLSSGLFESSPTPVRSKAGSFSVTTVASTSLAVQQQPSATASGLKPSSSELPIPYQLGLGGGEHMAAMAGGIHPGAAGIGASVSSAPVLQTTTALSRAQQLVATEMQKLDLQPSHNQPIRHQPMIPLLGTKAQPIVGCRPLQSPIQFGNQQPSSAIAQQQKVLSHQESSGVGGEFLRADFVLAASDWFSHMLDETKGSPSPEMSHSVKKYEFRLDCDASARRIIQVIDDRLKALLKTERVIVCRSSAMPNAPARKRLQHLRSLTSDPVEFTQRDLGRPVSRATADDSDEPLDLALLAFNEQLGQQEALRAGQQQQKQQESAQNSGAGLSTRLADQASPERGRQHLLDGANNNNTNLNDSLAPNSGSGGCGGAGRRLVRDSVDEDEQMRIWRNSMEPMQAFARRMSCVSSLGCWRGAAASHHRASTPGDHHNHQQQQQQQQLLLLPATSNNERSSHSNSKFLPCLRPFIPRQRLLYLVIRGETINLFLYNYTNEVVAKAREIVERTTLWHNARSRLLREIGLHKMGITHLSTLKSTDAKYNSYLLLTWMDPETLIQHEYPVDSLTTPDFSNIPRIYSQLLLKLYRFADPAFVAKHISLCPFEDQSQQMLALREDVRTMLNDHRLYMEVHAQLMTVDNKQQQATNNNGGGGGMLRLSPEMLARLISHCHLVHFVQTPLLLFPDWRRRVAAIRAGPTDLGWPPQQCRKHSFPSLQQQQQQQQQQRSAGRGKSTGSQRPGPFPVANSNPTRNSSKTTANIAAPTFADNDEPCSGRIQRMLLDDYADYLRSLGLSDLHVEKPNSDSPPTVGHSSLDRHPSGAAPIIDSGGQPSRGGGGGGPEHWLCCALEGGMLFLHLSFMAPYFCLRLLQWNAQPQLDEHLRPNQQQRRSCVQLDQQQTLRALEHRKNELVRRCHLHSFVYDFHLRMMVRYLIGDPAQLLFSPGYNTNAFLVDFLQYYGCRPPSARNCVYEETVHCAELQVGQQAIWEYFLGKEQKYGWKVVRLKSTEGGAAADEFMLVAKERRRILDMDYQLIRVVANPSSSCSSSSRAQPSQQPMNSRIQRNIGNGNNQISLRLYVLLVTDTIAPYESATNQQPICPSTEAESTAANPVAPDGSRGGAFVVPYGGEFTHFVLPNSLARPSLAEEPPLSPCSTLIEQRETESGLGGIAAELESFGEEEDDLMAAEEEEDDHRPGLEECTETRVVDRDQPLDEEQQQEISMLPAAAATPLPSAASSQHSLPAAKRTTTAAIQPSQLSQPAYCYECVVAAAAELRSDFQRRSGGGRQRFCSGGILLSSGQGRRSVAARMSLPPSRTSTNSSSSLQQRKVNRQRSDSSQLSTGSAVSSPTKKELPASSTTTTAAVSSTTAGARTRKMTPANSLKGLSEWRANYQQQHQKQQLEANNEQFEECDWTLFEEPTLARNGQKLAIQRNPPRRHRNTNQSGNGGDGQNPFASFGDTFEREKGAVVPPEQVTYLHYLSNHQRRLQHLLEEEARANRLAQFVTEADRFCYVDALWKALLASKSFHLPSQKAQSLFLSSTSSKSDMFSDANFLFGGRPSISMASTSTSAADMEPLDFEALLRVVGVEAVVAREPRLRQLLQRLNWGRLCRFIAQFYEGERRCRYFESSPFSFLIITNPQFLDSAAMFRHNQMDDSVELFLLFKQAGTNTIAPSGTFAGNTVRKLLEELLSCLCAFVWSNLLQISPTLG